MRKWLFLLSLFMALPVGATLHEQLIYTPQKNCAVRYLSKTTKKLWTLQTDETYCKEGFLNGFTIAALKDSLNRTDATLSGFFYQGYYLSDFIPNLKTFYRSAPEENVQDFIYPLNEDKENALLFYGVARATQVKNTYSPFVVCSETPILLVAHHPASDFKQALFQAQVLKKAKARALMTCPQALKVQIIGIEESDQAPTTNDWIFKATMDIESEETTLFYRMQTPTAIPKPSELKQESAQNLMTVHPKDASEIAITYGDPQPMPDSKAEPTAPKEMPESEAASFQALLKTEDTAPRSAVDLALIAEVNGDVKGKSIVYIETTSFSNASRITRPLTLNLKSQNTLASGWYLTEGLFHATPNGIEVELFGAKPCLKEWCTNEN